MEGQRGASWWHAVALVTARARALLLSVGLISVCLDLVLEAGAQSPECRLARVGGFTHSRRFDSLNYVHRASGGIDYRCTDGTRIVADSAVVFEHSSNVQLFGRVRFDDPDTELDADSAQFFANIGRFDAWSNVTLTERQSGAVVRGDSLMFLRASGLRAMDRILIFGGSPHATVFPTVRSLPADTVAPAGEAAQDDTSAAASEASADSVESGAARDPGLTGDTIDVLGPGPPGEDSVPQDSTVGARDHPGGDAEQAPDSGAAVPDSTKAGANPPSHPRSDSVDVAADSVAPPAAGPPRPPVTDVPAPDTVLVEAAVPHDPGGDQHGRDPPAAAPGTDSLPPYEIDAQRFIIDGRRFFRASGDVVVTRDSLAARGDSLDYDQNVGTMSLFGNATVSDRDFQMTAATVSVTPTGDVTEEILAREEAVVVAGDVEMTAPAIRMFVAGGAVERLVALPVAPHLPGEEQPVDTTDLTPGDVLRAREIALDSAGSQTPADSLAMDLEERPRATAGDFTLAGDSIDVRSPGQRLETVTAVGRARAEATDPDTTGVAGLPAVAGRDWMTGETIVASFASADTSAGNAPGVEVSGAARMETLTATGQAEGLYRLIATDTTGVQDERRPALHLVRGDKITIHLSGREVMRMEVEGKTVGYHLEPALLGPPADTTEIQPDTTGLRSDTLATRPLGPRPGARK